MSDPFPAIGALGVVPVIAIDDARDAVALADALLEGGLGVAEIAFRTAAAAETPSTKAVAAVGGAWIARAEDIRERRFADIAKKARAAVARAAEIRGGAR